MGTAQRSGDAAIRPRALDLFCGGGGASMGLHRSGFDVVGVDVRPQPHYPFAFIQADATRPPVDLAAFDFIWASPPCQFASKGTATLAPHQLWCIENVPDAGLRADVVLDGTMFPDLRVIRRRHFEVNFPVSLRLGFNAIGHVTSHGWSMVYGGGSRRQGRNKMPEWQAAMGIDWLPRRALAQAIPPAYSEFIGLEAMAAIRRRSNGEHSHRAASLGAV